MSSPTSSSISSLRISTTSRGSRINDEEVKDLFLKALAKACDKNKLPFTVSKVSDTMIRLNSNYKIANTSYKSFSTLTNEMGKAGHCTIKRIGGSFYIVDAKHSFKNKTSPDEEKNNMPISSPSTSFHIYNFLCTNKTKNGCLDNHLMGAPKHYLKRIQNSITKKTKILLYNMSSETYYIGYTPNGLPSMNIDPNVWPSGSNHTSQFPAQLRVSCIPPIKLKEIQLTNEESNNM
jgi:hypothetical protein